MLPLTESGRAQVQFAVGFKFEGKTEHVVVDAEDALIAALKVKMQRPEVLIAYVRQQNKRGDTRQPMRRLSSENQSGPSSHLALCDPGLTDTRSGSMAIEDACLWDILFLLRRHFREILTTRYPARPELSAGDLVLG